MLDKVGKVVGIALTVVYGGYLVVTIAKDVKEITKDVKLWKTLKRTTERKPEAVVIETYFVD